jgi:hypothetical protein
MPKKMETKELQAIEDARAKEEAEILKRNTDAFNDALEAIDLSYQRISEEMKNAKELGFTLSKDTGKVKNIRDRCKKEKKTKEETEEVIRQEVVVYSIRQLTYPHPDTNIDTEMDHPMSRIKLMVNKDGKVGTDIWNNDNKKHVFTPNVYDMRRLDKQGAPTLAKVKVGGKSMLLDKDTASSFITFKSTIGGIIDISDIVISKFGISLYNRFKELYVKRHKSAVSEPSFTNDDLSEIKGSDDDSDEVEVVKEEVGSEAGASTDIEDHEGDEVVSDSDE